MLEKITIIIIFERVLSVKFCVVWMPAVIVWSRSCWFITLQSFGTCWLLEKTTDISIYLHKQQNYISIIEMVTISKSLNIIRTRILDKDQYELDQRPRNSYPTETCISKLHQILMMLNHFHLRLEGSQRNNTKTNVRKTNMLKRWIQGKGWQTRSDCIKQMPEHVVMKTSVPGHTVFVIIVHKTFTMNADSWLSVLHCPHP